MDAVDVAVGPGVMLIVDVAVIVGSAVGCGFFVDVAVGDGSGVRTGGSGPSIALMFPVTLPERTCTAVALSKSGALS
jgi:hypothetical protein